MHELIFVSARRFIIVFGVENFNHEYGMELLQDALSPIGQKAPGKLSTTSTCLKKSNLVY